MYSYPFGQDPGLTLHPRYAELRESEPLAWVQMPYGDAALLVTRYADVRAVFSEQRFSRKFGRDEPRTVPQMADGGLFAMDPPEHTRIRGLVAKVFTVRRVEQLRSDVEKLADHLVDEMVRTGSQADLVEHFAVPLPVTIMCELLGIPVADRRRFARWTTGVVSTTALTAEQSADYRARLGIYLRRQIALRRANPCDSDLLGALVQARDNEERLSEEELVHLAVTLLTVGFDSTATEIPNFMYLILSRPELRERLWSDPGVIPTAVEELLRYIPIVSFGMFPRYATTDIELPSGVVRAGVPVLVVTAAANRDPRVFTDPERIVLDRTPNPHLALGHGVHHCLGAPLARMELQTTLSTLIRRLPELRLAIPQEDVPWKHGQTVRGPRALPVTW